MVGENLSTTCIDFDLVRSARYLLVDGKLISFTRFFELWHIQSFACNTIGVVYLDGDVE
jgi:hypothetical protein